MLRIKWNEGDAINTIDLLPDHWFTNEVISEFQQHTILGVHEFPVYAMCSMNVDGRIVELDYAGEYEAYNRSASYIPGVMRLTFADCSRTGIPEVEWKGVEDNDFKKCDVTVKREPAPICDIAPFEPNNDYDGRRKIERLVSIRQGQSAFREALLTAYRSQCALTGCRVEAVLQAAHIMPFRGDHTNHINNGLLLRADIHTLFDLGIIKIDREYRVTAPASIMKAFALPERITNLPVNEADYPSPDAFETKARTPALRCNPLGA